MNQDFTNLLIARSLIFEIIKIVQKASTEFLYQSKITEEEFNQIFETVEIPLCSTADDIAIILDQNILTPVESYEQEFDLMSKKIKSVIENSEDFSSLNVILGELVNNFTNIIITKDAYPDTSRILNNIESICK